jgi:hypothetical protein
MGMIAYCEVEKRGKKKKGKGGKEHVLNERKFAKLKKRHKN